MIKFVRKIIDTIKWWLPLGEIIETIRRRKEPYPRIPVSSRRLFATVDRPDGRVEVWWWCGHGDYSVNTKAMSEKLQAIESYLVDTEVSTNTYELGGAAAEEYGYVRVIVNSKRTAMILKMAI